MGRGKQRKVWLTEVQTTKLLEVTKSESPRDWLIEELCRHGLRIGEVLGMDQPRTVVKSKKHPEGKVYGPYSLPGIKKGDLRDNGIWLTGKGYRRGKTPGSEDPPDLYPLPAWLAKELNQFSAQSYGGKGQNLFDVTDGHFERLIKRYARIAEIPDWQDVSPHRLRAFFATDLDERGKTGFTIRNMMRHKKSATTDLYIGPGTPLGKAKIMESLTPA